MAKPELKEEAIRLRVQGRRSLTEIKKVLGVSKGILSVWLRPYPLTAEELHTRHAANGSAKGSKFARTLALQAEHPSSLYQTVQAHKLNGVKIAKVAEAAVMLRLLACGFNVYGSVFDGDRTDWLVEVDQPSRIWKIQVKAARRQPIGLPGVALTHGHSSKKGRRRYVKGEFDFIVGYDLFSDVAYVWSWADVAHLASVVTVRAEAREAWVKLRQ